MVFMGTSPRAFNASGTPLPDRSPAWRDTHVGINYAADMLGVSRDLIRGLIGAGRIKLEEVQDSRGRTLHVISKDTVRALQARMASQQHGLVDL